MVAGRTAAAAHGRDSHGSEDVEDDGLTSLEAGPQGAQNEGPVTGSDRREGGKASWDPAGVWWTQAAATMGGGFSSPNSEAHSLPGPAWWPHLHVQSDTLGAEGRQWPAPHL